MWSAEIVSLENRNDKDDNDRESRNYFLTPSFSAVSKCPIFPILPIFPMPLHTSISKINFLLEGLQIQRSGNFGAMGCTQSTAHCYNNLLAAVDAPLSQEIT